jgi:hypothetical protein
MTDDHGSRQDDPRLQELVQRVEHALAGIAQARAQAQAEQNAQLEAIRAAKADAIAGVHAARGEAMHALDQHAVVLHESLRRELASLGDLLGQLAQKQQEITHAIRALEDGALHDLHGAQHQGVETLHHTAQAVSAHVHDAGNAHLEHMRMQGDQIAHHLTALADQLAKQMSTIAEGSVQTLGHARDTALTQIAEQAREAADDLEPPSEREPKKAPEPHAALFHAKAKVT